MASRKFVDSPYLRTACALLGVTVSLEARLVSATKPSRWAAVEVRKSQHDPKQSEPSRTIASEKLWKAST